MKDNRWLWSIVVALLLFAAPLEAQVTITYTFTNGTTADADQVNTNFSALSTQALNRTGGTLTGNIAANGGVTVDGIDIGATVCVACTPTFAGLTLTGPLAGTSGAFTGAVSGTTGTFSAGVSGTTGTFSAAVSGTSGSFSTTLGVTGLAALNSTAANALDVAGGIQAGSGNVSIIDTTGKIPAISGTYFASLSGTSLTGVALLASVNTFSAFGTHTWSAGAVGSNGLLVENTSAGVANLGRVDVRADAAGGRLVLDAYASTFTSTGSQLAAGAVIFSTAAGGLSINASDAAGALRLYTGGVTSPRWGVNAAGDHTFGSASHISDSSGTPSAITCTNCGGSTPTITGTDYAFVIGSGAGVMASPIFTVTFGHTWTAAPICTATSQNGAAPAYISAATPPTTTQILIIYNGAVTSNVYVLCRGY